MDELSDDPVVSSNREKYELEYLYRDGGNYKYRGYLILDDFIDIESIKPFLIDSVYFIPSSIGMKSLAPCPRNNDDHEFHEFVDVVPFSGGSPPESALRLIQEIKRASMSGWIFV